MKLLSNQGEVLAVDYHWVLLVDVFLGVLADCVHVLHGLELQAS